jgi:hypothetical protein
VGAVDEVGLLGDLTLEPAAPVLLQPGSDAIELLSPAACSFIAKAMIV